VTSAVVAVAITAACSDRAERKVDSAANATGTAAVKVGSAAVEVAKDVGSAGQAAARATGAAVMEGGKAADAVVETIDVKMALTADSRVDAGNIDVDADHVTRTVTLNGRVPTQVQKTLAEDIAKAKATGYVVRNLLAVGR